MLKRCSAVSVAITFLVAGNLSASLSDVAVKLLSGGISPFQYMFVRQLLCVLLLLPFWLKAPVNKRQLGSIKVTLFRSHLMLAGSGLLMVALTYLPLATANAVFYTAPLIMLPLSIWLLGEKTTSGKVVATLIGFIGVMVILRPSQFHWAAIFALGCAFTLALYNILVKKLPRREPVFITLFWTSLLSLPFAGLLSAFFWQPLSYFELVLVAASAFFTMGYHASAVSAYKRAVTSHIALAEYSGLIFVSLFGVVWFEEYPDGLTLVGILLIVLPMILGHQRK
ncbi:MULTISPECIES: DMT family transporter [Pseudoalteromonas]|uniref:Multidrug transporter n=1 Tax=Pseudoalteromonas amylolytica TaxID=1859457 RepID=A0A1S1N0J2_9GAMM|nr:MULTISPECIES: DMT family transporter [Pseudoalteromonas]OHU90571.1 multidrug transporter [Pseudoalteromonas sp. JW3]OHU92808.1 multidrug transporter [Pseudoalteromonas amylolytica]